ncbi:ATP-binding protein [Bifidobacterium oedipodis]|uniref:ATPase n=1 Tax=Bifidobacterium oedipodis TaxID=2675322 RepID=A0A7Y0HSJ4_9BIFI|nr:ATP-binding protein [Bifidobacterium sp. DSM 109957]NMM95235.1 ATPase [Bifidobacterium sp. DSM 109957]
MFHRKAYAALEAWKQQTHGKRALLVEGARRVGKSTLVREFAKKEYSAHLVIDFSEASDDIKDLFHEYRADVDSFFMYLQAYTGVSLPRRDSVIVFDEVQRFPTAREFIKQLVADGRYDYIETGSLISIRHNVQGIVVPSEETSMRLNPLDFEEFLCASGQEPLMEAIRTSYARLQPLPDSLHRKAERLFREYMLVGGMPQTVEAYIESKDFGIVDDVKRDILTLYRNDISHFGAQDVLRIRRVLATLPSQLARHEKKFKLSSLDRSARSREYADAFFWLSDACISATAYNVDDPSVGLSASMNESSFKCYMSDTGLLISQLFADNTRTPHELYRDILLGKLEINEGMFTENIVAQQFVASGHKLFFYSKRDVEDQSNTMEIDFLLPKEYDDAAGRMRISPVEVKSTKRYAARSLDKFKTKFGKRVGTRYILHPKPMSVEGDLIRLPLYMADLL